MTWLPAYPQSFRFVARRAVEDDALHQRRAVDGDVVSELADFLVADDEDGFVLAQFGFAGDERGAVVHVGGVGVAGQQLKGGVAVALAVDVLTLVRA